MQVLAVGLLLLAEIRLMLIINKLDKWLPRVAVVDVVAKPGCVDDIEVHFETFFFKLGLGDANLNGLLHGRLVAHLGVGMSLESG